MDDMQQKFGSTSVQVRAALALCCVAKHEPLQHTKAALRSEFGTYETIR